MNLTYVAFLNKLPVAVARTEAEAKKLSSGWGKVEILTFPESVYNVVINHGGWSEEAFKIWNAAKV